MAPRSSGVNVSVKKSSKFEVFVNKYCTKDYCTKLLFDPHYVTQICWLILFGELILNVLIIENVRYTEIDWKAYMQEVEGVVNGTFDYKELKGDTGPLVYPAGFVYFYMALYYLTGHGRNVYLAQYFFLLVYLVQTFLHHRIIRKTAKLPPYALILALITSYRIHSIYVLRLFNDPIAVLFFYLSLNLFISGKWTLGSLMYSVAVSMKMNILLYAPALLIAFLTNLTYAQTLFNLFLCGIVQLALAIPFLYSNPISYIKGSFDLARIFEHKWTVNYRFLSIELFENRSFHFALLTVHVLLLLAFTPSFKRFLTSYARLKVVTKDLKEHYVKEQKKKDEENEKLSKKQKKFLKSFEDQLKTRENVQREEMKLQDQMSKIVQLFVLPFFVANLIGITCARSLHYQFYSWYYHSLLYLVFSTRLSTSFKFLLYGLIEFCWNVYPSTDFSSGLLHVCHVIILWRVYCMMRE